MLTETKSYQDNLVKLNPNLMGLNRYKDILPCKIFFFIRFIIDEYNRVDVLGKKSDIEEKSNNYINASFINVIKYQL